MVATKSTYLGVISRAYTDDWFCQQPYSEYSGKLECVIIIEQLVGKFCKMTHKYKILSNKVMHLPNELIVS